MPSYSYLRKWNDRTILVRPTKWDGAEEVSPWDCLDITDCRRGAVRWGQVPASHYKSGFSQEWIENAIGGAKDILLRHFATWMGHLIDQNPHLYRSRHFCKKYADNPRMDNPLFGCSIVAAEALYFLIPDDKERGLFRAKDNDGIWHYWAQHTSAGGETFILDATNEQFSAYDDGKKTMPIGRHQSPSKRTLDLIAAAADFMTLPCERYRTFDASFMPPSTPGTVEAFME
jgi:hypothetical protein